MARIRRSGILNDDPVIDGTKVGDVFAEIAAGLDGIDQTGITKDMMRAFPETTAYIRKQLYPDGKKA
jgi:hypothetical protein